VSFDEVESRLSRHAGAADKLGGTPLPRASTSLLVARTWIAGQAPL
jgi:hypothetical protein